MLQKKIGNGAGEKTYSDIWFLSRWDSGMKIMHKIVARLVALVWLYFFPKLNTSKLGQILKAKFKDNQLDEKRVMLKMLAC